MVTIKARGRCGFGAVVVLVTLSTAAGAADEKDKAKAPQKGKGQAGAKAPAAAAAGPKVSYDKQVRPILQAQCQGCHQPAKAGGGYVMTAFDRHAQGRRERHEAAIVPGKPEESFLVDKITPQDGKAEMPQDKPPLSAAEIELIARWIAQGAVDDTPPTAKARYDLEHPPEYTRLPVIPALAFSPDGSLLAVAGFHEVLLWKADGSELVARLVGLSRADRVAGVLARRQEAGRHRRPARPDGRGPGLGRRQAEAGALGRRHL